MGDKAYLILSLLLTSFLHNGYGCQMDGITLGPVPVPFNIRDTFRGAIVSTSTTNIESISNLSFGEGTRGGPYLDISLVNSQFVMQTTAAYEQYEENEIALSMSVTINFSCTGGGSNFVIFVVNIEDTNNNPPQFIPSDEYEFVVAPPLPPGFLITGCLNDITVRDIDLTTSSIIFAVEENPYFEIEYDAASSTTEKEFKAQLKTSTFIRTLREPVTLRISATDVDATEGPPITTYATVRISGDTEFEFPEEPMFSQAFYFATYTRDHTLIHTETISLQQGFDENVDFSLEGEYRSYFTVRTDGNRVSLDVSTHLPVESLAEGPIYLVVRADREFTSGDSATIVIQFPEVTALQFERVFYNGAIVDNVLQLPPLILSQGHDYDIVSAEIIGEYATSFAADVEGNLVTLTMAPLADDIIEDNSFISIPVVALTALSEATTIVSLEIIKDDNITPTFDKAIYTGTYVPNTGLTMEQIVITQGFDATVDVVLGGEHANLFQLNHNGPTTSLVLISPIPPELYTDRRITLSISALKPRTVGANGAIIIDLPAARELNFEELTYRGTIQDNYLTLQNIMLRDGYDQNVQFSLSGEFNSYFTVDNLLNEVTISLTHPILDEIITRNTVITLVLTASGLNAVTTTTTILLDIIKQDTITPLFSQYIYYGMYNGPSNFAIENILLAQGLDNQVSFRLDGDHAQYFEISDVGSSGDVTITLRGAIPEDVIFNEKVLLFNILAEKALTVGSSAAVLIRFPPELTDSTIMRFSQNTYIGALDQNEMTLENIVLETAYTLGTEFILSGDYAEHFLISNTLDVVHISSLNTLPSAVIENNDFIVLVVEARRQRAVSAWTSIVVDIVKEDVIHPVFNQAYYRGSYTRENGLQFTESVFLLEGYNENIDFELEGEHAVLFSVTETNNVVTVILNSPIPETIIENNNQLLFTVIAQVNEIYGRAVISIDLPQGLEMSFSHDFYKGELNDGILTLDSLSIPGFSIPIDATYTISGDYVTYFQLINENGNLILELIEPIPDNIIEDINLLVFVVELENTQSRIRTLIIVEVTKQIEEQLSFERAYYVGTYSQQEGLNLDEPMRLASEDSDDVVFELEGEDAQWFRIEPAVNSITLVVTEPIPQDVIDRSHRMILVMTARKADSAHPARATIVITLSDGNTEGPTLRFDQINYQGSIENNLATLPTITLSEGYVPGVVFTLHGDLASYFSLTPQGAIVTVTLQTPIPEQSIPSNRIIVLEIQASATSALPARATLVYAYNMGDNVPSIVELIFDQAFYTGSYTDTEGLIFSTLISLTEEHDASVEFSLEGDNAQWFYLVPTQNLLTLELSSPIPAAVLANNQQLIFVVIAQRDGSTDARATIVISLTADYTEGLILGFDQVTYQGSIENNLATLPTITLSEGYVPGVVFTLHGDLASYFSLTPQGAIVTVTLQTPIPEQSIPSNRIIVLEIQASATSALPARATLVYAYNMGDNVPSIVELIFDQAFYTGSYTDTEGLIFSTLISLTKEHDASVEFSLEGDNAQWFYLVPTQNSLTLELSSPIPAAVLANNQQLIFVVIAQRDGSTDARATIVISLTADYTEGLILGFDQVTYQGSIENNLATLPTITLSEGYVPGVVFTLHGDLASYFSLTPQGAIVTVTLQTPIPEQSIPSNRIIVLEIQASATSALPARATLVYAYNMGDNVPSIVELIFDQAFYTGSYTDTEGLIFSTLISLTEEHDASVEFALEGDNAQWFYLVPTQNSLTLELSSPIPAAVLANNQQLIFVVIAQRDGSTDARATIVISLTADYTEGLILGFDQVTYQGSIENNLATLPTITLSEGYVPGVVFTLHGDLASYFSLTPQGAIVTVTLQTPIPEQSIPSNRIIVLEIQASATSALPARATLVYAYNMGDNVPSIVELIFDQAFYTGSYTDTEGLIFSTLISLTEEHDASVEFSLEGDNAQWFYLVPTQNSLTLELSSPIPAAVLANNQQLIFVVIAQRDGSTDARATIVISLTADYTEGLILGFDQVTYQGSIENNLATLPTITLSEGYVPGVVFTLHGDLASYFSLTPQGAIVTVTLQTPIPEQSIPSNRIIVLEIQASATSALPARATLVYAYNMGDNVPSIVELIFDQAFYTGSYTDTEGLIFSTLISLTKEHDASVEFSLEGDNAQWFYLVPTQNSLTLELSSPIPAAVLANNQQLIFVVIAQRDGSTDARATIVISLTADYTEGLILGFDQVTYQGSIENNLATLPTITLSEGYVPGVVFTLHGDLASYFSLTPQGAIVTVTLQTPIPEQSIPSNRIIVLEIQASATSALPARATLVYAYNMGDNVPSIVELIFDQAFYTGSYTDTEGLIFSTLISLTEEHDASVEFALEGDNAQWFYLVPTQNSLTLELSSPIPAAVLANNQQLIFVVIAQRDGSTDARATIVISLTADYTEGLILGFDQVTYQGSIENNLATLPTITLSEGYVPGVVFTLHGDLASYFSLTPQGAIVTVTLQTPIPEQSIPSNRIIVLEIQASATSALPARATLVYAYNMGDNVPSIVELIFDQAFYTGSYTDTEGLIFSTLISLTEEHDASVEFALEGDNAQWFYLVPTQNSLTLELSSPIPAAVLANNQQLIFVVIAQRDGSTDARATIVISLTADYTEGLILGFDQVTYQGSIENNLATLPTITLSEGYVPGVVFTLHGDLASYFSLTPQGAIVTVTLQTPIPEQSIPSNRIIVLEIQASATSALPARATLVYAYNMGDNVPSIVELIFDQAFYTGSYTDTEGLIFSTLISLTKEHDASVEFSLEGDNAQWFYLVPTQNSLTLELSSPIPAAVLANNQQLIFVVIAQRDGSTDARATIVISLTADYTEGLILGFDQVTYQGSIENNLATLPTITLSEGYVPGVVFTLHGDLASYFSLTPQGAIVTVTLQTPIPEQSIPSNRIIVLEIQASATSALPARATLVYAYNMGDNVPSIVELIFDQAFYTGSYTDTEGLIFSTLISLTEEHDASVEFSLEGDNAQWFYLVPTQNSLTLELSSPIPAAVLANNQQLIFVVIAQRDGSTDARATIVISLTADYTEGLILGFDQVTYQGSIENNLATLPTITLSEGYVPGVVFTLHGDLASYFSLTPQGAIVTVTLQTPIPEQSIPSNRIIVLEIQASATSALPARATLVYAYNMGDNVPSIVELIFDQAFYTGSYTDTEGLIFSTLISLTEEHDASVEFALEGDNAQWFYLVPTQNSLTLELSSPIPAAVLANNQQLIFVVIAQRDGSTDARATIVISLTADYTEGLILGFDQVTYQGSIENNLATLPTITLSEGYVPGVVFTLHGDLASYFSLTPQGAIVTVTLQTPIPEQSIPSNRIIVLEIQASATSALPARATLVYAYNMGDNVPSIVELIFDQAFYTGSYTDTEGLIFSTLISLTEEHDASVEFALEGDNAQWFYLVPTQNSLTLELSSPIPAAVLANNQQLIFVVIAQRDGSTDARATIVISLTADYTEGLILGFDQVTYQGSIENNLATLPTITLSEGYVPGVVFTLHGDLASYFSLTPQGAIVTVTLQTPIPEQSIPSNRIIVLEIQASATSALPARATLVYAYNMGDNVPSIVELIFDQAFYTGSYTDTEGLIFSTLISLTEEHDASVEFALEGDNAQWFYLVPTQNSLTLELSSPIPAAVLANNQQLIFVVIAQRDGSTDARATIVISLTADYTEGLILGFDQVTYQGSIENNLATLPTITLSEGYVPGVVFTLHGDLASYFSLTPQGAIVTVTLQTPIPEQSIPSNRIIVLEIQASATSALPARATLVYAYNMGDNVPSIVELIFDQAFYTGSYTDTEGLIFSTLISLTEEHDASVEFALEGDNAQWFYLVPTQNSLTLELSSPIPAAVLANNQQLIFVVIAQRDGSADARATIVISLTADSQTGIDVWFDKVIFEGVIENGVVNHETITIIGYTGASVEISGAYASLFVVEFANGIVTVRTVGSAPLPADLTHLSLELRAGTAAAVLILSVSHSELPSPAPVVTFSSASYAVRVDVTDTGVVGQVHAAADNGEDVRYSLQLDSPHLSERLSVSDAGELHLSAPANSGLYTFQVLATTVFTQATGLATVHLTSEAITVCGDELVMQPLIVLDRDEEEPHRDLMTITHDGCHFSLSNRWPLDQTWLYVDETGLHATAIDREHPSIAFMALSQVQVEVTLHCDTDVTRSKRSLMSESLGPYDYGNSKWVLTDTILYNSRRSLVNLIVNDINDNAPVFVGKAQEPITVGYPVAALEQRVLPRSLAELQATDADIGENAALVYWSSEPVLAVAPTTGFVHIRDGASLENDARLTVHATDRRGQGLTGSIDILVKLLDERNIVVVTVKDAFLDEEANVLSILSESVGYDVKVLRAVVISEDEEGASKMMRESGTAAGATLQLYVYGLIQREPVSVERLTQDISNSVIAQVNIASTVSLEDHLAGQEICVIPGRDTGLLAATIVLSVLLFIIIVLIAVWFFLRWRKNRNYDQFSDENSLASRNEVDQFPKPVEVLTKPRLNIEELKKSERRLQEMLDAPIEDISVEPTTSRKDAIIDIPSGPDSNIPIVIQSIDKLKDATDESSDDEFGERINPKRKSVVTFNENVEKIIHVEDNQAEDLSTTPGYEIYKL